MQLKALEAQVRAIVGLDDLIVEGSAGKGNWAETPWVAVFDPLITDSPTHGFYLVYLIRTDGSGISLSLNQGVTQVRKIHGAGTRLVLEAQAGVLRTLVPEIQLAGHDTAALDLHGTGQLTADYEAGNVAALDYDVAAMPSDSVLERDLKRLVSLYEAMVDARQLLEGAPTPPPAGDAELEQALARTHLRIERNQRLRRKAVKIHGTRCEACGFSYEDRYGELGAGYVVIDHLVPLTEIKRSGEAKLLDPLTDFAALCASCHAMVHRQSPPLSLEELKTHLI